MSMALRLTNNGSCPTSESLLGPASLKSPAEDQPKQTCSPETKCAPLQSALFANGSKKGNGGFGYCDVSDESFESSTLAPCTSCLQSNKNEVYLLNFLNVLSAACVYKPAAGELLVRNSLFSADGVEIVVPETDAEDSGEEDPVVTTTTEDDTPATLTETQKSPSSPRLPAPLCSRRCCSSSTSSVSVQQAPAAMNPYPIMTDAMSGAKDDAAASPSSYSTVSSFQSAWTVDPKVCSTATLSWTDVEGVNTTSSVPVHPAYVAQIPGRKSNISDRAGNFV
ncbi:unnamed protein product [Parascedosporium putredinis]|uniref:Uncharacterized protein n=1 Tax=Parascedosporium putredinis TaxID=1442378 RepID=A0A9P1H9X5_9PEZI|nr:unnamed protein product [Parascedosporium putredinis]CAI8004031.1 unnamed protein product [Parascedosporium putredinis]